MSAPAHPRSRGAGAGGSLAYNATRTFTAYDEDPLGTRAGLPQQTQQPQPLRRRGAPVPAPTSLMPSSRSSPSSARGHAHREDPYSAAPSSISAASSSLHETSTATTTTTSPPHDDEARQLNRTQRPPSAASSAGGAGKHATAQRATHHSRRRSSAQDGSPLSSSSSAWMTVSVPATATSARQGAAETATGAPASVSRRARQQSSRSATPERGAPPVPSSRAPGSTHPATAAADASRGPFIVRASTPAAVTPHSLTSFHDLDGHERRASHVAAQRTSPASVRSVNTVANSSPSAPVHTRQQTQAPSPSAHSGIGRSTPRSVAASASPGTEKGGGAAPPDARQALRQQRRRGEIQVQGYVAQTAYAQRNPFRTQDFAEFAANPQYHAPPTFDVYPQAMATRVYGREVSRASQGEFMMQRLVDAAHPTTAEERAEMEALLSATLEKLQVGDWFYKWTRINHVQQRYVWLNLQRGTLMWSLSPKQSVVLNAELKLSTVTSITPDCLQLDAPLRVFYRMVINTPDRCISIATEIRKKFDVWYRVLLQLTAPNLMYGVPGVWGRPSCSVNATGRGAVSRWESRFSPLTAIMEDTSGAKGSHDVYTRGVVSSSD